MIESDTTAADRPLAGFTPPPLPGPPEIKGAYALLERLDPARHGADLARQLVGQEDLFRFMPYSPFHQTAEALDWLASVAPSTDPLFYAFCDSTDGRAGGYAALMRSDAANGVTEIGHIMLSPAWQGDRRGSSAIMAMIGWAFAAGYRRVEWKCNALNAASRRAARRYGFAFEGIFRNHMIVKGRNRDTAWFSLIDSDWPEIARAHEAWLAPDNFDAQGVQKTRLSQLTAPLVEKAEACLRNL